LCYAGAFSLKRECAFVTYLQRYWEPGESSKPTLNVALQLAAENSGRFKHALSKDLVHWTQLKEALYPFIDETEGARSDAAFSGSAVSDPQNTSGFRKDGIDPLIVIYTSTGRGECLKLSYDRGLTFEEYPANPILKHNGRDPKVFWYEPDKHWTVSPLPSIRIVLEKHVIFAVIINQAIGIIYPSSVCTEMDLRPPFFHIKAVLSREFGIRVDQV
jgi:hypothetical protein